MNMQFSKAQVSYWLPKALEGEPGHVDTVFLHSLWQRFPKVSSKIRALIKDFGAALSPKDSAIEKLAELLRDQNFLSYWFSREAHERKPYPPFSGLISSYLEVHEHALSFDGLTKMGFLVEHKTFKKKYFPNIDKLPELVDCLCNSKLDNRYLSLFVWDMMLGLELAKSKFPTEPSIQEFDRLFVATLKQRGLEEVLEGAFDTAWKAPAESEDFIKDVEPAAYEKIEHGKCNEGLTSKTIPECVFSKKFNSSVDDIEERVDKYKSISEMLMGRVKSLRGEDEPCGILRQVGEYSKQLEEVFLEISRLVDSLSESFRLAVGGDLLKLGIKLNDFEVPSFALSSSKSWVESIRQRIASHAEIILKLEVFKDSSIVSLICKENSAKDGLELEDLSGVLADSFEKYQLMLKGEAAEINFIARIKENALNLQWNIFRESKLHAEDWEALAEYYILKGVLDARLSISVQQSFGKVLHKFGELLCAQLNLADKLKITASVEMLSWLTLAQLEQLAKSYPLLRVLIALTQLEAYFKAVRHGTDYFVYWSASPLSEISNAHSSSVVRDFFKSIYDIVSSQNVRPLDYQMLAFCVSSKRLNNPKASSENGSVIHFESELKGILAFRKKGGRNTYAHIWQAAYADVFQPLLDTLESSGLNSFVDQYEKWEEGFDIDGSLDAWKSEIPEHLKKNSEYDKFLRKQVNLKVSEIHDWLRIYRAVTQRVQTRQFDPLAALKASIDKVFRSQEQDCFVLRAWLESKASVLQGNSNFYFCQNRDWNGSISCVAMFDETDVYHPRAFAKIFNEAVTYEDIYTDDFVSGFGFGSVEKLVDLYAANELFEGYASVANDSAEEIAPSLDRKVEKLTEELAAKLKIRLQSLEHLRDVPSIEEYIKSVESCVDNQLWRLADKTLVTAEAVAAEIVESARAAEHRRELLVKIERLGGGLDWDNELDIGQLSELLNALQSDNKTRRVHVKVLEKLSSLTSTGFEDELKECLEYLDCIDNYPGAGAAEQVAYYFEQAVDPLYNELSRSGTLLGSYVSQLRKLGKTLIRNIRKDQRLFEEDSNLIAILIDTAEQWQKLSSDGKVGVDQILEVFALKGVSQQERLTEVSVALPAKVQESSDTHNAFATNELLSKAKAVSISSNCLPLNMSADFNGCVVRKAWKEVASLSLNKLSYLNFESEEDLENWAISSALDSDSLVSFSVSELSSVLRIINGRSNSSVVRYLHQDKSAKASVADLVGRLISAMAGAIEKVDGGDKVYSAFDALHVLYTNISKALVFQSSFRHSFEVDASETIGLKAFWEKFAGDQKQAEARAYFMYLAWRFNSSRALAYCLTLSPIDLEKRKAEALAKVANDALVSGNSDLLQGFYDLKKSIQAKPFQIFADLVLSKNIAHAENAAKITLVGDLERHNDGTLRSILRIEPRRVDSPDTITLKLPSNCPVKFSNDSHVERLSGPFFTDTSLPISFILLDEQAVTFNIELVCSVVSLTGAQSSFNQKLEFSIANDIAFESLSPDEIDDDFDNFPDAHMRGENYVPRVIDEQKIEKALFKSKTVRSIWISSPRRSGKTTMLYRILDAFSHKVNRDNLVVYLTLDEFFADSMAFNRWIWRRLRTFAPNRELRELYEDFEAIGRDLPFDSDTGTFIGELSDRLLKIQSDGARIIFLIDEVDRFAAMYFEGGIKRSTAVDILWQIRHTVTDRRDIGIVFAGSSAAKQVFISDAESPFYNSIDHLELTPFSCRSKAMEDASRQIVEPHRLRFKYHLPKDTLEHLVWVCAGIPYYMKLLAGATYATVKQSHILKADVNEGLRSLLGRTTGISKLDEMGGDPGSDDLRTTISIEKSSDGTLARAVLYAFADIHSPISGHKTYRGKMSSAESRLISHYSLTKAQIERGLDICIGLGLIRIIETESVPEIDFVIPILGESLRKSSGRLWANIDHELIALGMEGN
ncbi:Archaeal ATPase [Pseudomonas sp. IsoF]|uniref:AAA-like domain-containing protein n=1 Tax=Pseudomonas sp. IsoF TaxID=2821559 RepID=UPI0020501585|nr:AAA-like domain-containing protein [Pseudomonas sp. IsoF]UPL05332.1 Archaeal ATPase [Pseudomonas sp. IsoF]